MLRAAAALLIVAVASPVLAQPPVDNAFFEAKVRPVLAASCFKCHGGAKTSSGLRVDSRAALVKGGKLGPALVPGDPDKSVLLQAMRHTHDELRMPPGRQLPQHVLKDFAAWIKHGAPWPANTSAANAFAPQSHWAFQPVRAVSPPADPTGWAEQPIDRFISARLREQGLAPVGPADRRTLLRRLTFDLIGLPPTPEETEAFVRDRSDNAYEKAVERLLTSPHHGERWGRHWLDVARYADTAGDNADYPVPEARLYRDYVIDAFNADLPFDQFVQEQIAGDLIAKAQPGERYKDRVVATGFLALSRRYATAPYELWHLTLEDTIDTVGQAFLGLSLRCARCHDHKFDPVTREDYYGLYAIFARTTFPYAGSEEFQSRNEPRRGFVPLTPDADARLIAYRGRCTELATAIKGPKRDAKELAALQAEERLLHRLGSPPDLPVAYAVSDGKPVEVHIHLQGDPERPGPRAVRRVPQFIEGRPVRFPKEGSGRLELARWLTRPDNPLTPRVIVNRVWHYHFGRGLVATPNNLGLRGGAPSHPELLDYLSAEFIRHGWSLRWLHRTILRSKTYQLASVPTPELLSKDPGNVWLGRFSQRRLNAEALRDALLAVSGTLDRSRPGLHPFPAIQSWSWTQHAPFKQIYPSRHRSVYLMTQRFQKHPFFALFDGPDTNASTAARTASLLPLQALYMMNDPFVHEQAESFARRLLAERDTERRIDAAHQLAWGRPATPTEAAGGVEYLRRYEEESRRAGAPADRVELEAWTSYARVMMTANAFVFVD